jgi:hypothetical protein
VKQEFLPPELIRLAVNEYMRVKQRESRERRRIELLNRGILPPKIGRPRKGFAVQESSTVVCTGVLTGQEAAQASG